MPISTPNILISRPDTITNYQLTLFFEKTGQDNSQFLRGLDYRNIEMFKNSRKIMFINDSLKVF